MSSSVSRSIARCASSLAARAPAVVISGGDDASGMASMLADLLTSNLRDFPSRARAASIARGNLVLQASDRDVAVTLTFQPGRITITDGPTPTAPLLYGPWMELAKLCSAQSSPMASLAHGHVRVSRGSAHGVLWLNVIPLGSYSLSVPGSFYDDPATARRRRRRAQLVVACLGGAAAVMLGLHVAGGRHNAGVPQSPL